MAPLVVRLLRWARLGAELELSHESDYAAIGASRLLESKLWGRGRLADQSVA